MRGKSIKNRHLRQQHAENAVLPKLAQQNAPQLVGTYEHPAYETFDVENRGGRLWFSYGSFETPLSFAKADGMICGYTGRLDGLVPDHIELWPDGNDLRLRTSDSELKMLFRKIK